jgi:hypothetical protein
MNQRRPKRRKHFRQPPKRLPSTSTDKLPPLDWLTVEQPTPARRPSSPASSGIVQPILPPQAGLKGEGGLRADTTLVRAAHKEMLQWIEVLEAIIVELQKQPPGVGHNLQPIGDDELHSIINLVFILKHQPVVPTAPDDVRAAGSRLKKIGERLGTYLDIFLLEASKSAGRGNWKETGASTVLAGSLVCTEQRCSNCWGVAALTGADKPIP